jgi:hypothetical protein
LDPTSVVTKGLSAAAGEAFAPAAKELGAVLAQAVRVGLAPLKLALIPLDELVEQAEAAVSAHFSKWRTPPEAVQPPDPTVASSVMLRVCTGGRANPLRDQYLTLLARAMDSSRPELIHPAFVEILSQLTPFEASALPALWSSRYALPLVRIERHLETGGWKTVAKHLNVILKGAAQGPSLPRQAIDNFARLRLIAIHEDQTLTGEPAYDAIKALPSTVALVRESESLGRLQYRDYLAEVTDLARDLLTALDIHENDV